MSGIRSGPGNGKLARIVIGKPYQCQNPVGRDRETRIIVSCRAPWTIVGVRGALSGPFFRSKALSVESEGQPADPGSATTVGNGEAFPCGPAAGCTHSTFPSRAWPSP